MHFEPLTLLAIIGFCAIACQWLAWWWRIPAILPLIFAGLAMGPVTGFVQPDALFGPLLPPLVSLGVAVILFEGGLTLRLHEVKQTAHVVGRLLTFGVGVTWIVAAGAAYGLGLVSFDIALLFGAIVTVTGPTVIAPMLRTIRPSARLANILKWEGITIDPLGAMLAILMFEYILIEEGESVLHTFGMLIAVGVVGGIGGAALLGFLMRRHMIPQYLLKVTILTTVLVIFGLCNMFQEESGLLAVTLMGIIMANWKDLETGDILDFKESLSILIISWLFIVLAANIPSEQLLAAGWRGLVVLAILIAVARPLGVLISTAWSPLTYKERALLTWIAPRGIVAAAVASLFSYKLAENGVEGADMLLPLVFTVIIGTVVLQSLTSRPLAKWLGVAAPEANGVLIVGGNALARKIGISLKEAGFPVMLTDTGWDNVRAARMAGLNAYMGNILSEHAERNLDTSALGVLLAMSRRPTLNALACLHYKAEFGADSVFAVQMPEEEGVPDDRRMVADYEPNILFGPDITQTKLASMLSQGHEIRTTGLSEDFTYDQYKEKYGTDSVQLFAITPDKRLKPFLKEFPPKPRAGWSIISLLPVREEKEANGNGNGSKPNLPKDKKA